MAQEPIVIPDKIYFKIGEVCEIVGVQAHVLRYWETEFSMLSPQKNKSGQRSYRRKDVEVALRIKQLLYSEMFTIAGARKKLQVEARSGGHSPSKPAETAVEEPKLKPIVEKAVPKDPAAPGLFDDQTFDDEIANHVATASGPTSEQREALRTVASQLLEIRAMLSANR
jgi:DNA-binding transcriptional MerR regulator